MPGVYKVKNNMKTPKFDDLVVFTCKVTKAGISENGKFEIRQLRAEGKLFVLKNPLLQDIIFVLTQKWL